MTIEFFPLTHWKAALKGWLAGSLIIGGTVNPWGLVIQIILFIIGLLILIDSFIPFGTVPYIVTAILTAILGGVLAWVCLVFDLSLIYLGLVLIVTAGYYLYRFYRYFKK